MSQKLYLEIVGRCQWKDHKAKPILCYVRKFCEISQLPFFLIIIWSDGDFVMDGTNLFTGSI